MLDRTGLYFIPGSAPTKAAHIVVAWLGVVDEVEGVELFEQRSRPTCTIPGYSDSRGASTST